MVRNLGALYMRSSSPASIRHWAERGKQKIKKLEYFFYRDLKVKEGSIGAGINQSVKIKGYSLVGKQWE
jgi:hypothetical protein